MPLDPARHTGRHLAPPGPTRVAYVAYERKDGAWDLCVFEPPGVCPPEWERLRLDPQHLHVAEVADASLLPDTVAAIDARLDTSYDRVPAAHFPDAAARKRLGPMLQALHRAGRTGYEVRHEGPGETLYVRRRDLPLLGRSEPLDLPPPGS